MRRFAPPAKSTVARFSALLDTCVLVPIVGADLLLRLADAGLFRPLWSAEILGELRRVLIEVHPDLASGGADRRIAMMTSAFMDASVHGWEPLIPKLELPDPNDSHVLAAAIAGRADLIVTNNLRDFPPATLTTHGLEAQSLDDFLLNQLDLSPDTTLLALQRQAAAASRPPLTHAELLSNLDAAGAPLFAKAAATQLWRTSSVPKRGLS